MNDTAIRRPATRTARPTRPRSKRAFPSLGHRCRQEPKCIRSSSRDCKPFPRAVGGRRGSAHPGPAGCPTARGRRAPARPQARAAGERPCSPTHSNCDRYLLPRLRDPCLGAGIGAVARRGNRADEPLPDDLAHLYNIYRSSSIGPTVTCPERLLNVGVRAPWDNRWGAAKSCSPQCSQPGSCLPAALMPLLRIWGHHGHSQMSDVLSVHHGAAYGGEIRLGVGSSLRGSTTGNHGRRSESSRPCTCTVERQPAASGDAHSWPRDTAPGTSAPRGVALRGV